MKEAEAERKLTKLGWSHVRRTGQGHDIWESPGGERRLFAFHEPINRNTIAAIRQAERAAQLKEELMATTSMEQIEQAAKPEAAAQGMRIYRTRHSASGGVFAELFFDAGMADHLGGLGAKVDILRSGKDWLLQRIESGRLTISRESGTSAFKVRSAALAALVPPTRRVGLKVKQIKDGYILELDEIEASPLDTPSEDGRKETVGARQAATAPTRPVTSPDEPSPAGGASTARSEAFAAKWLPEPTAAPAATVKRSASLDELRAALDLLRTAVSDLGVTLHAADGSVLDLRDVSFRGKV